MKFSNVLLCFFLSSALIACGGNKETIEIEAENTQNTKITPVMQIFGSVSNMPHANVLVYTYQDGLPTIIEQSIQTDDNGQFDFTLSNYTGPVKVVATTDADTQLICDVTSGCNGSGFGEVIDVAKTDPNFELSAIAIVEDKFTQINLSPISHLASALIEVDSTGVNKQSIQTNTKKLANTLKIDENFTELKSTNITISNQIITEDNKAELKLGLINSSLHANLQIDNNQLLSESFTNITNKITSQNCIIPTTQNEQTSSSFTLTNILKKASQTSSYLVDSISKKETKANQSTTLSLLANLQVNFENYSAFQKLQTVNTNCYQASSNLTTGVDAVTKSKAMVEDIRLFANLFNVNSAANQEIVAEGEVYLQLLKDAKNMVKEEADSFILLSELSKVITSLVIDYKNEKLKGNLFFLDKYILDKNARGYIYFDDYNLNFVVNVGLEDESLNLTITANIVDDGFGVIINYYGSIDSPTAKLTINENSSAKINLNSRLIVDDLNNIDYQGDITSGELVLDVKLEQQLSDSIIAPITFEGLLDTNFTLIKGSELPIEFRSDKLINQSKMAMPEVLTLSGGFNSTLGNKLNTAFTINVGNLIDDFSLFNANSALSTGITLGGYEVDLLFSASTTDLKNGQYGLDIIYKQPGETLQRSFFVSTSTEDKKTITITNMEHVTATLDLAKNDSTADEVIFGHIIVGTNAVETAQIVNRKGLVLIIYADGTVETL